MNTRYFHALLKARARRKHFVSIQTEAGVVEGVLEVKGAIKQSFYYKFKDHAIPRPGLKSINFKMLFVEEKEVLEEMFSREEIK